MKIYSINNISNKQMNFKGTGEELNLDNLDAFIRQHRVSLTQCCEDLLVIHNKAEQEYEGLINLKRTINEEKELGTLGGRRRIENPFDLVTNFDNETSSSINSLLKTQKIDATGIIGKIASEDSSVKSFYHIDVETFRDGIPYSSLVNKIKPAELNLDALAGYGGVQATKSFEHLFLTFRQNDTVTFKNALEAFSEISRKYFGHVSGKVRDVKELYSTGQKWVERVPGAIALRYGRVSEQQQAMKYIHGDYCNYCDTFIHNGIHPIAQSYVQKIKQCRTNIDLVSPYLTNIDLVFVKKVVKEMEKLGQPLIESYIKLLSNIVNNGESIAAYYKAVNNGGNVSMIVKTLSAGLAII